MPPALSVAAWLDAYRTDLRAALDAARHSGYRLVQGNAAAGGLAPRELSRSARRHLRKHLENLGLELDALGAEFPGRGLLDPRHADGRFAHFLQTLELAADLGVPRATVRFGGLDQPDARELAAQLTPALAAAADRFGIRVAVHAAGDDPTAVLDPVRRAACPQLGLGISSAAVQPDQVPALSPHLVSVTLRDVEPTDTGYRETPFGQGIVDFPAFLGALEGADYHAPCTIRRLEAAHAVDAMSQARQYVESLLRR